MAPTQESLAQDSLSWAARAGALQIVDRESYINASHLLRSIKGLRTEIARFWEPHLEAAKETKRKADEARKALVAALDQMEAPLVTAEGVVKRRLLVWDETQDQIRRAQERALQLEAQQRAEAQTLEAAAALELEATATGDAVLLQEAQDILAQPIEAPVVSVAKLMPKVEGVTYRDNFKAHPAVDVHALAVAVGNGSAPVTFLLPNMTAINAFARATQGTQSIAGVKFFNDRLVAARG